MDREDVPVLVFEETQPIELRTPQRRVVPAQKRPQTLPHHEVHKRLGIVQMCIGSLCFVMSIVGFCLRNIYYGSTNFAGAGIYTGIFYVVAGLLGFLAYRNNSRYLALACMVVNIIAACVTVIGLTFAALQLSTLPYIGLYYTIFQRVKCGIIILCCAIEFIITIVHASFTCASFCYSCLPQESLPGEVSMSVGAQPLPHTTIPDQTRQQLPQQQSVIVQQQPDPRNAQQTAYNNSLQIMGHNNPPINAMPECKTQPDASHPPYRQNSTYDTSMDSPQPYVPNSIELPNRN